MPVSEEDKYADSMADEFKYEDTTPIQDDEYQYCPACGAHKTECCECGCPDEYIDYNPE